jgi:hypothetical protein
LIRIIDLTGVSFGGAERIIELQNTKALDAFGFLYKPLYHKAKFKIDTIINTEVIPCCENCV